MFSRSICSALVALTSVPAVAELKPGLGFSVGGESAAIMVPVDIDERFRIEPTVAYRSSDGPRQPESSYRPSDKYASVGVGIFKLEKGVGSLDIFYGARLSYSKSEYDYYSGFPEASASSVTTERYGLAPTLGVEYYVADTLSLGGEVFVAYYEAHGVTESEVFRTGSQLTARFFF